MISLTVTGHAEPEQDRTEIARLLKEYGPGAVCLLRNGCVDSVNSIGDGFDHVGLVGGFFMLYHSKDGRYDHFDPRDNDAAIIRVFPPGTRLRVTVEVVE